ncbi:sulfurtransferase [Microlunatus speluncae]|uniref:sulfurtransferase n=1 Tax=Microlunatus speluncae TaxID=2594267 RepID=UPI0012667B0E|nr:sulfurtransferase [Microlunatus speluncae]
MSILITPTELAAALARPDRPVLLDVRWTLAEPDGRPAYRERHLPGAVYADLDHELAAPPSAAAGRHPLPDLAVLQAAARGWGIDDGAGVVVYDHVGNLAAARAWWLLRYAGLADVRILDGGLGGWLAAELPTESGEGRPEPGSVTLEYGSLPTTDLDDVMEYADRDRLIDVRAAERYRGETEPIDPRAGHIPGARNAPTFENLGPDQRFLDPAALRARYAGLGLPDGAEVAVYCGSGVTAAHAAAALTVAGYRPVLYPGSWSQWSNHPDRPVETGDTPRRGSRRRA